MTTARRTSAVLLACALGVTVSTAAIAAPGPGPKPNPHSSNNGKSGTAGSNGTTTGGTSGGTTTGGTSGGTTTGGSAAGTGQSTGNAGTIKVAFPSDNTAPGNDAKPGCTVRLDFYGFRLGSYHAVFNAIAPTGSKLLATGDVTVTQSRTPASAFQTSKLFTLDVAGLTPDNAGYHVGVKVTNPANPGSGGKSKNFSFPCVPGNAAEFSGGAASIALDSFGSGASGAAGAPVGGFATGFGGPAPMDLPMLPLAGLVGGLALLGAGAVRRRKTL